MALDVCPATVLASLLPMLGDYLEILGDTWSILECYCHEESLPGLRNIDKWEAQNQHHLKPSSSQANVILWSTLL